MTRNLRITIGDKSYDVTVEVLDDTGAAPAGVSVAAASASASAPAAAFSPSKAAPTASDGDVPSPLAGKVVAIDVNEGDDVAAGDQLITLEAMKMNTFVTAPQAGKIAKVLVGVGDAVEEGQGLVSFG